jgi:hypothetical protein
MASACLAAGNLPFRIHDAMSANREVLVENRSRFSDIIKTNRESRAPREASFAGQVNKADVICITQAEDTGSG